MANISQIERQLYILSLLSESKIGCTISNISDFFAKMGFYVSKKTISRDMDYLSIVNFPIFEEKQGNKVYYNSTKFGLENISFTPNELISLYFIKEILNSYANLEIGSNASFLIERIISHLPQINRSYLENLNSFIKVNPVEVIKEKALNPELLDIIRYAIIFSRSLFLKYSAFNRKDITERIIDPYFLEIHDGCYHLIAFCHLRNNIREFRVTRIRDIKILENTFSRPAGVYEKYKKSKFRKLAGEQRISLKIRFTGIGAKLIQEYEQAKADKITSINEDEVVFIKDTTMSPEIIKWVLSYGADAEVLEPKELRGEVIAVIQEMGKKYLLFL